MKPTEMKIDDVYLYIGGQAELPIRYDGMMEDKYVFTPVAPRSYEPAGMTNTLGEQEVVDLVVSLPVFMRSGRQNVHDVTISRVMKNSPYNCAGYIPEITCSDSEKVIEMKEVKELIDKTYGKKLIVTVNTFNTPTALVYEVVKPRAII